MSNIEFIVLVDGEIKVQVTNCENIGMQLLNYIDITIQQESFNDILSDT